MYKYQRESTHNKTATTVQLKQMPLTDETTQTHSKQHYTLAHNHNPKNKWTRLSFSKKAVHKNTGGHFLPVKK